MKKIIVYMAILTSFFISEGFVRIPHRHFQRVQVMASSDFNPRGEPRPHDGRGNGRSEKGEGRNQGECQNPEKGAGYGNGGQRGNGQYRK